jgi:hypothetical protein
MAGIIPLLTLVFGLTLLPITGYGQECGELAAVNITTTKTSTQLAIDAIKRFFAGASAHVDFVRERDSIFTRFPDGEQTLMNYIFYRDACLLIKASSELSPMQKLDKLMEVRERLYTRVTVGPVVADTRKKKKNSSWSPPVRWSPAVTRSEQSPDTLASAQAISWRGLLMSVSDTRIPPPPPLPDEPLASNGYLRDAPYVVTRANKYFVIVGSVSTLEAGLAEMDRLKRRAPNYDFVLYEPYGDNIRYGIMMATWVSFDVARKVLALAKRNVNPQSYIWACRHEGNRC